MKNIDQVEVSKEAAEIERCSHDASGFTVVPQAVYYPKNTEEVQAVIQQAKEDGVPVSVRAGGTCMSGGSLSSGYILDLTKYMNDVSVDAESRTATVGAGAWFKDIEVAAKEHELFFAGYPSSKLMCGIGGMLGNNASGEKSLRHGPTGKNVLELEVVLADGSVVTMNEKTYDEANTEREETLKRLHAQFGGQLHEAIGDVKKAASGYRLDEIIHDGLFSEIPLMIGAQGTLGIITRATLKLVPLPQHTELLLVSAQSLEDLSDIVTTAFEHNPEGLETFDTNTFARARVHLPEYADLVVPYVDVDAPLFILIQLSEDTAEATKAQAQACHDALAARGCFVQAVTEPDDVTAAWKIRRNSFTLMKDHNEEGFLAVPCIEDVIVPIGALGEFIHELITILEDRNIIYGFHGHIGDGSFRVIPIFDFRKPNVAYDIYALMEAVFILIKRVRGNTSADHGDGIIRTPFLEKFYGPEIAGLFSDVKQVYDPDNLLNPGKKVGGTWNDVVTAFKTELVPNRVV